METKLNLKNLSDLLKSEQYQIYQSQTLLDIQYHIINQTGKDIDLMVEHQEAGFYGCSHGEIIENWREFLNSLKVWDSAFCFPYEKPEHDIQKREYNKILREINECEQYHESKGTINQII